MAGTPTFSRVEVEPGRYLHCVCEGPEAAPFVLFDAGAFGIYADGWWIKEALKKDFRVCLYDRAGMGASDPVPEGITPSPDWHVADMRRLMHGIGISGRFILVGHSMAGLRLHTYANLYPELLRGLVLIDALSPRQLIDTSGKFLGRQFGWILKAGAAGAKLGLAEPVAKMSPNLFKLEGEILEDKVWSYGAESHHAAARDEVLAVDYEADYLHGEGAMHMPLAVFSATAINGLRAKDVAVARENAGFGWRRHFLWESHVSILTGNMAVKIADKVREIDQLK